MTVRDNYRLCIVVERTTRWPIITLHLYWLWRETLNGHCIHKFIHKFIMPSSRTESESWIFFTKPAETDRLQDFENRNNTNNLAVLVVSDCNVVGAGRGGQSALRFARLRMEKRHNYVRKVAETAVQMFITNDRANVAGLVLAGSADFKTELSQSDMFDQVRLTVQQIRHVTEELSGVIINFKPF